MKWIRFAIAVVVLTACSQTAKEEEKPPPGYFYFPRANVYYDTASKNFIYFDSASKQWLAGNLPPTYIQSELGKSVLLDSAPEPVWADNQRHQLVYAARLYADSQDFKKAVKPVKKPKARKDELPPSETTGRKTKIGEILNKIFGKKKEN